MPYNSIKQLPSQTKNLPVRAKKIFMAAFNNSIKTHSEEASFKIAMAAVESQYTKKDNKWVKKSLSDVVYLDLYITKAVIKDGEMQFHATASDTGKDLYGENMSVELYKSFVDTFNKSDSYVSLAHYPSFNGRAELGKVTELFIDGEKLKARGIFYDNPLGIAGYNAIKRDRRENTPFNQRIRVSIGFWDEQHKHGDIGEWSSKSGTPCYMCAAGIKEKVYLKGRFEHLALTRCPARITTDIDVK